MEKLVYIIDLDGTVWEDVPNEVAHSHTQSAKLFDNAIEWIIKNMMKEIIFAYLLQELKALKKDKLKIN